MRNPSDVRKWWLHGSVLENKKLPCDFDSAIDNPGFVGEQRQYLLAGSSQRAFRKEGALADAGKATSGRKSTEAELECSDSIY